MILRIKLIVMITGTGPIKKDNHDDNDSHHDNDHDNENGSDNDNDNAE